MQDWLASSWEELVHDAILYSHGNLHSLLAKFGLVRWSSFSSLTVLSALGVRMYFNRKADICLLIGVTACVSQFYTHHALPMIVLFWMSKTDVLRETYRRFAQILLAFSIAVLIAPEA